MNSPRFPRGVEVVGSAIIENGEGKILLTKSPKWHNKWTLPGGHIEAGERIEAALLREAEEEVGLKLTSSGIVAYGEIIGSTDFHRPAHFIYFDIWCKTDQTDIRLDQQELTEYAWVDPEAALTWDLAESYDQTLRQFLEYRKMHRGG